MRRVRRLSSRARPRGDESERELRQPRLQFAAQRRQVIDDRAEHRFVVDSVIAVDDSIAKAASVLPAMNDCAASDAAIASNSSFGRRSVID